MMSKRAKEILSQLTLEEKCRLCAQEEGSFGRVERLGLAGNVPQDNPRDGADYFRSGAPVEGDGKYHPVALPSDAALAMGWDEELAYEAGSCFAMECRANPVPVTWLFRPGVNIKRSPLCGRNFEYFSEDPVLAGELAGSYIKGVQENGVAATLKHFICNNQEFERMTTNSVVSDRALHEIYLRPFEIAIEKGNPWSVMSSYNQVNGEWVNSNQEVCDLLRKELGYEGVVVSDFAAVHKNKAEAHNCGMMDIELAPSAVHSAELLQAVKEGRVKEETLDRGLERVFDLVLRLEETAPASVDAEEYHEKARGMAEKCTVLLKNDGILPLSEKAERVLVIGALAEDPSYMGGGSGHMNGYRVDSCLEKIRENCPDVKYEPGYLRRAGWPPAEEMDTGLYEKAVTAAKEADTVILYAGLGYCYESEGYDRKDIRLPEGQKMLLDTLTDMKKKIILVLFCGSVLDISPWNDQVNAVLYPGLGGEAVGGAVANILFGKAEPGGRLAETWPMREEDNPAYMNFAAGGEDMPDVIYGEDIYVGYRWYEKRKIQVLYPFGHGLSYTAFEVGKPVFSTTEVTPETEIRVSVPVKNTGSRKGSQVVQLYIAREGESICKHPVKELKAFGKIELDQGETGEICLSMTGQAFRFYSPSQKKWLLEDGGYKMMIGTSSEEILYEETVVLTGGDIPYIYTEMTPLAWFVASEKFHRILRENFPPQLDETMHQETFEWCCLIAPMPFYKITEPFMGQAAMNQEQMRFVLNEMNKVTLE